MKQRMPQMVAYVVRGVVSVIILIAGLIIMRVLVASAPEVARSERATSAPRVEWYELARISTPRLWHGYGTAQAKNRADVSAEVSAIVTMIAPDFEVGFSVERGELLARLDPRDFELSAEIARQNIARIDAQIANLKIEESSWQEQLRLAQEETDIARREFEAASQALDRGAGSPIEVDRRRRELNAALRAQTQIQEAFGRVAPRRQELIAARALEESRLAVEQRNIDRSEIRSPINGLVQERRLQVGERVSVGETVARIINLDVIEVPLSFPVSAAESVRIGDAVSLRTENGAWRWDGVITRVSPVSDRATRSIEAYAEVEQSDTESTRLRPGQFVEAVVSSDAQTHLAVPRRAILDDAVLVAQQSRVQRRRVDVLFYTSGDLGGRDMPDQEWAVLADSSQVSAGDHIVVSNVGELRPGMMIVEALQLGGDESARAAREDVSEIGP